MSKKYHALVPAAGVGARMGTNSAQRLPKQYLSLAGRPMIWHALATLCAVPAISTVFVVLAPDDDFWPDALMADLGAKLRVLRCGGDTRALSVTQGLQAIAGEVNGEDWMLVHDAARPCLTLAQVETLIATVGEDTVGGLLAMPVADTLKRETRERGIREEETREQETRERETAARSTETVSRSGLWQAQTPQMFRHRMLLDALNSIGGEQITDEASAVEATGYFPLLVAADSTNFKVTYPLDLKLAEWILQQRSLLGQIV